MTKIIKEVTTTIYMKVNSKNSINYNQFIKEYYAKFDSKEYIDEDVATKIINDFSRLMNYHRKDPDYFLKYLFDNYKMIELEYLTYMLIQKSSGITQNIYYKVASLVHGVLTNPNYITNQSADYKVNNKTSNYKATLENYTNQDLTEPDINKLNRDIPKLVKTYRLEGAYLYEVYLANNYYTYQLVYIRDILLSKANGTKNYYYKMAMIAQEIIDDPFFD